MSAALQPTLFDLKPQPKLPAGFSHQPEFLSAQEEAELAGWLATLPFEAFQFRGYEGKRRVVSFGWKYDFTRSHLTRADDMPAELLAVRERAAAFVGLEAEDLQQCLLNEYLPGAPIGWHRDRPMFEKVVGISLLSPCNFRLRHAVGDSFERTAVQLEPRSIYGITGEARTAWEHSIPPVKAHRYSITFRNFRDEAPQAGH
ncbi:alpha-ketoglutarate-dependent dioxygenase AlkB [Phenylobacterium sp.]|jgi:alkylated DNA repair dioxygenase AlkB|uniref:alpha-ketoglutarate-dependent dioxygenase AlkB n=1 Tax=Phenylobacterium sp. TaxID=1871053 RepID=UPI002E37B93C|nr:alpha-ketoglutarate-dependent dioxygenase AlkB [Phenylobacterium sp.]HEX3363802.1 alpha-ketoglutarate-dependent dioxygenase AlkB [Phenylobacterium sp.]